MEDNKQQTPAEQSLVQPFAPFDAISAKIEEIKRDVRVAVEAALLEESIRFSLGRLTQLKPDRSETYAQMLELIGT